MYTLVSAIARQLAGQKRWVNVDISNVPIATLYNTYSDIIATLSNPFLTSNVALDLSSIRSGIAGETITFNQFLINNGTLALPTLSSVPVINPKYAKYADAFHAGYSVQPIEYGAAPDAQLPLAAKTSLWLSRENTDYNLFYESCLVSVNGFYHKTDADTNGAYVIDGMKSQFLSNQNLLGIYSFRELGTLSFIPITTNMVYKQNQNTPYYNHCYINLGQDVSDKTVMLVLGGYLHILDDRTFFRVGTQTIGIDFSNFPLLDRFFESKGYIDLSSLNLETTSRNPNQVAISQLFGDDALLAYLTLSQSFFVVLDNTNIFLNQIPVPWAGLTDMYVAHSKPEYPLVVGVGKHANYWYTEEVGLFSLNCYDAMRNNRIYDTVNPMQQMSVSDARLPERVASPSKAYFLQVGVDF